MAELLLKCAVAYLLGGVMGGDLMRRLLGGGDLRQAGSGNVGATNALRTRGPRFALGVLLVDIGKGVLAVLLLPALHWTWLWHWPWLDGAVLPRLWIAEACGVAVTLGHCYPVFKRFRGGKGVATLAGVYAALLPMTFPWMLGAFVLTMLLSGYVGLASVLAGVAGLAVVALGPAVPATPTAAFATAMALLVLFKHRDNLRRIAAGSEHCFERARLLRRRRRPPGAPDGTA